MVEVMSSNMVQEEFSAYSLSLIPFEIVELVLIIVLFLFTKTS